jgi:hypothetical protein
MACHRSHFAWSVSQICASQPVSKQGIVCIDMNALMSIRTETRVSIEGCVRRVCYLSSVFETARNAFVALGQPA